MKFEDLSDALKEVYFQDAVVREMKSQAPFYTAMQNAGFVAAWDLGEPPEPTTTFEALIPPLIAKLKPPPRSAWKLRNGMPECEMSKYEPHINDGEIGVWVGHDGGLRFVSVKVVEQGGEFVLEVHLPAGG